LFKKLFKGQDESKEKDNIVAPAIVAMDVPEAGQFLAKRFDELKKTCKPLSPQTGKAD